jgi:predicted transcriptional regulator
MRLNRQAAEIAMAERGFNKIDLARKMGVPKQVVYKYLGGSSCRPKTAKRFVDALDVPVRDLFECEPESETDVQT